MVTKKYVERIPVPEPTTKVEDINALYYKTDFPQTKVNNGEEYSIDNELVKVNDYKQPDYLYKDLERSEYATVEEVFASPTIEEIPVEPIVEEEIIEESEEEIIEEDEEE